MLGDTFLYVYLIISAWFIRRRFCFITAAQLALFHGRVNDGGAVKCPAAADQRG
jgi:hypothetical protein